MVFSILLNSVALVKEFDHQPGLSGFSSTGVCVYYALPAVSEPGGLAFWYFSIRVDDSRNDLIEFQFPPSSCPSPSSEKGLFEYRFSLWTLLSEDFQLLSPSIQATSNHLAPTGGEGWGEGEDTILT